MTTVRGMIRVLIRGLLWLGVAIAVGALLFGAGWLLSRLLLWLGVG